MTSLSDSVQTAVCACGSGLSADRCCRMNTDAPPTAAAVPDGEPGSEAFLARVVRLDPNDLAATQALALALFNRGALAEAEPLARNAVRLAPTDAQSHNLMGMILTEAQRPQVGEHHYRRALELLGRPAPILLANLAWNLKNQGRMAEARAFYEQSMVLDPGIFQTVLGWAKMEETDRNFARAGELLDDAEGLAPGAPSVRLARAVLHGRTREYERAVAILDDLERERGGGLGPLEWSEKGLLLDKMCRHADAFAAFTEAKRSLRELTGQAYMAEEAAALVRRLASFFTASRLSILPRAGVREGAPQPIFIVGFPRSGTTMVEQTLSAHPKIAAGDELPIIGELTGLVPRMLSSPLAYPEALADLWLGDQIEGLDNLRDYYLQRARQLGATPKGAAWFTDKMPLNETHLGLIHLIFPQAPIIHLLRHPLDVVLSVFSNHLTHGFYCAYDLASIARHYVLIMDLVEHYRREMPLNYLAIRYEDIVADQEASVKQMLGFIGAPFDRRCLAFHENRRYARTASYAQVTEKLYDRSRYRYRAYRRELEPVIPILEPTIRRLGYAID
jgi:Tfp pilus assembly protein PilF